MHKGASKELVMQINPINLKRAREAKGLSLERLAGKAKIDKQTIYRIEAEPPKKRRALTVKALADALGLTVTELCGPDLELEAKERAEPRIEEKAQLNVRVSERIRNSFALLAVRYHVTPSQVVQIAPFLFLWAAERSLQLRRERAQLFRDAQSVMDEAVPSYLSYSSLVDDRLIDLEEHSIAKRDIFGMEFKGDEMEFLEHGPNSWSLPLENVLRSMLADMPEDTKFEDWEFEEEPRYEICRSDAVEWLGGDTEAAQHFLAGLVPLRDIPNDLLKGDGAACADWIKKEADRRQAAAKAARDAFFESLDDEIKERLDRLGISKGKGEDA
jgi:transcriptional regulator with XRE-family HTH domain